MSLTFTPRVLSNSVDGKSILVTATESPGQILHTVQATTTDAREEVRLQMYNNSTGTEPVAIEWGSTDVASRFGRFLPSRGNGISGSVGTIFLPLTATTSIIRAYTTGTATDAIRILGQVNRAT